MKQRSRQCGHSENSVPDMKKSLPTGQLMTLRPEDGTSPTAGQGGREPRGLSVPHAASPRLPDFGARGNQGAAICRQTPHPAPRNPSWPRPPSGAPSLLGRQPPLTHVLVTTVLPRHGDTSASVLGRIFHMKWPSRESVWKVSQTKNSLCKGPGVRAGGAEVGPFQHLVRGTHPAGRGEAWTCPWLTTWTKRPGQGTVQAWAPALAPPPCPGDLPQVTSLPEPRFLIALMGLLGIAP